jgi:undecaprenyl pyrophosphate synthase
VTRDLVNLTDDEVFSQIGGDWDVLDCLTELGRRLSRLRAERDEAREKAYNHHVTLLLVEGQRDRLLTAMRWIRQDFGTKKEIVNVARGALRDWS